MTYCPKCRHEYFEHIEVCPDCDVDLVPDLPPEIPPEYAEAEWVEVYTFPGTLYARMAVEILNREGIPSYSISNFGGATMGMSGGDFVGASATVFALEPDADQAYNLLEPMIEEYPGSFDDPDLDSCEP